MIHTSLAQFRAVVLIEKYISQCECETGEEIGNALMALMVVTSGAMINAEGHFVAVARTQEVINHLATFSIDAQQPKNTTSIH